MRATKCLFTILFVSLCVISACGHPPKKETAAPVGGSGLDDAPTTIKASEVELLVRPLLASNEMNGIVVGVVDAKGTHTFGFGYSTFGEPLTGDTVFSLGSVSKLFTSTLMAQMIDEGLIKAEDRLSQYVAAPNIKNEIELWHLATHSSGLPTHAPGSRGHDVEEFLAHYTNFGEPGTAFTYNNFGFGVLGYALSKRADKPLEALFQERIFEPLGMSNTGVNPRFDDQQTTDIKSETDPGRGMDTINIGSSSLRSTANDMLKFLAAHANYPEGSRSKAMALSHAPRGASWDGNKIGLAWHIHELDGYVWHQGVVGQYRCYVGFNPENQTAVVVWSTGKSEYIDHVGLAVLHRLAGKPLYIPVVEPAPLQPL